MIDRTFAASSFAVLLAAPCLAQSPTVWIVDDDGGPGVNFTAIEPAIAAAADGDVLLVRAGSYQAVVSSAPYATIDAKSLIIQGDQPGTAFVGKLRVANLSASQTVVVRGVDLSLVAVDTCAGPVLVEECNARQLVVVDTADCVVRSCTVTPNFLAPCEGGITAIRSGLYVYDSYAAGHSANVAGGSSSCGAGAGIVYSESHGLLEATTAVGGNAASALGSCEAEGLVLVAQSDVAIREVVATPGTLQCGALAIHVAPTSTLTTLTGAVRRFTSPSPARGFRTTEFVYEGEPGDGVWLAFAPSLGAARWFPAIQGYYHGLWPPVSILAAGTIPSTGELRRTYNVPALPGGVDVRPWSMQAYFLSTTGEGRFSGPTQVQVLQWTF